MNKKLKLGVMIILALHPLFMLFFICVYSSMALFHFKGRLKCVERCHNRLRTALWFRRIAIVSYPDVQKIC